MNIISKLLGNASSVSPDSLKREYGKLLIADEAVEIGFKVIRDTFIFTNRRLILIDVQGLTGKKIEYLSLPYGKITRYSVETVGHLDLDAELKIWLGSESSPIVKKFNSSVNIYELQQVLSEKVLI